MNEMRDAPLVVLSVLGHELDGAALRVELTDEDGRDYSLAIDYVEGFARIISAPEGTDIRGIERWAVRSTRLRELYDAACIELERSNAWGES